MEQIAATQQATSAEQTTALPYPPSWVDRLTDWVTRLPGPAWLFYLGVAVVLVLTRTIAVWSHGRYPVGTFFPVHVYLASNGLFLLFLLHYLDDRAGAAFAAFRPVLNIGTEGTRAAGYERLRYQLTTMPARPVLAWSLVGLVVGVGSALGVLVPEAALRRLNLLDSPVTAVMDYVGIPFSWLLLPVFAYHTVRQLRLVSRIYTQHTNVNIFETGPLYALSRVAAITSVALLFLSYVTLAVTSNRPLQDFTVNAGTAFLGFFVLLAVATFVWPLFGAHRLLQEEKERRRGEIARRMEALTDELHRRVDTGKTQGVAALKDMLDGLVVEQGVLDKISTWPWAPETVRAVVTALLLPVVLWVITRVLERLGF